jgi:hypothetical protein
MSFGNVIRPFRWDITRRNHLGSLVETEPPEAYPLFEDDLLTCSARVVAFAGDSDLVFVGRSPQPLFDLLSGLLIDTSWSDRLRLFNVSLRYPDHPLDRQDLQEIYPYFAEVGLEPHALARARRTVAFVDIVDTGETFGTLLAVLRDWSDDLSADWAAVARKIRLVGLVWRTKTSPNTWRWQQHAEWVERLRPNEIKNVSLPRRLATYLAEDAPKTSDSYERWWWGEDWWAKPARDEEARQALALAVRLFDLGRMTETRRQFARALATEPAMTESWFRSLILELKR